MAFMTDSVHRLCRNVYALPCLGCRVQASRAGGRALDGDSGYGHLHDKDLVHVLTDVFDVEVKTLWFEQHVDRVEGEITGGLKEANRGFLQLETRFSGPARGMYVTAQQGILPPSMRTVNKHDVPVNFVIVQGLLVSVWAAVLTFGGGGGNVSFFTAISLTVVIYLVAYLLFFIGYLVLVLRKKDLERAYNIPGGTPVKAAVAVIGFVISLAALGITS